MRADERRDHAAELAVCGGVLLDDAVLATVRALVRPEDFHHGHARDVFAAICALDDAHQRIDVAAVVGKLDALGQLNSVGGPGWVADLVDHAVSSQRTEQHARTVAECASVRRMARALEQAAAVCRDPRKPARAVADEVTRLVSKAAEVVGDRPLTTLQDAIVEIFARIESVEKSGGRTMGARTGIDALDRMINGMHGGQLLILAARPAMGKSALAAQAALNVAQTTGEPVLFVALEMTAPEIAERLLSLGSGVFAERIRESALSSHDMADLTAAAQGMFGAPLVFDDGGTATLFDIRAKARALKARHGRIGMVVVDFLQLMNADRDRDNREREVAEISRGLKQLAMELDAPVLALSQLNRGPETRGTKDNRPRLSDLRESGAIEQDANVVMFIYRDEVYRPDSPDKGVAEIIVAKQRRGRTGTVRARFRGELTKFENMPEEQAAPSSGEYPAYGIGDEDAAQ
jgi:replicative DNA helicase